MNAIQTALAIDAADLAYEFDENSDMTEGRLEDVSAGRMVDDGCDNIYPSMC